VPRARRGGAALFGADVVAMRLLHQQRSDGDVSDSLRTVRCAGRSYRFKQGVDDVR
jgi:hypothetical protein